MQVRAGFPGYTWRFRTLGYVSRFRTLISGYTGYTFHSLSILLWGVLQAVLKLQGTLSTSVPSEGTFPGSVPWHAPHSKHMYMYILRERSK